MAALFISYRRQDAAGWASRLCDELVERYGEAAVFYDVTSLALGRDFAEAMRHAVESCRVMLVVIGPGWLDAAGPDGRRRLDDPHDFIRSEVAAALRLGRVVVPVLVGGADMPRSEALPADLAALSRRNAVQLSSGRWDADLEALFGYLDGVVGRPVKPERAAELPAFARPQPAPLDPTVFDGPRPAPVARTALPTAAPFLMRLRLAWDVLTGHGGPDKAPAPAPAAPIAPAVATLQANAAPPAVPRSIAGPIVDASAHDVFFSYSTKDAGFVDQLVRAVEASGPRCWIAHRNIPPGVVSWAEPIVTAIASSRLFVVLLSVNSVDSVEVLREVTLAADERIPMLPVSLDAAPLSAGLRYFFTAGQRLDLAGVALPQQVERIVPMVAQRCPPGP